jgi:type III secretion protein D
VIVASPVLRVLNGRLAGTEKALPATGAVSIGHQFWHDVVVRDPATRGIAIDLALDADGAAKATVLEGEAELLGQAVSAGGTVIVPPYVPFAIGGVALAWGERDSERWQDATGLVAVSPTPPEAPPSARDTAIAMASQAGEGVGAFFTRGRMIAVGAAVGLVVLASATMPMVDALHLRGTPETRVEKSMAAAGLPGLDAREDPSTGEITVAGVVANEGQRQKAVAAMQETGLPGSVAVVTSADLARSATEVARIHGLQSTARPTGRTTVELRVTPLAPDQEQKLAQAVRNDVRALTGLTVRDDLAPVETVPLRTVQDATKKVSTVVGGDPAFIQTVDGARYFAGAVMPSGHRLVGIKGNTVVFEKSGRQTRVSF